MDVRFFEPGAGNTDKAPLVLQLLDGCATGISHAGPESSEQLVNIGRERSTHRHHPFDPLRDQLDVLTDIGLEIAVLAAVFHGPDRAHAAITLVGASLVKNRISRRLFGAGKQRTDHDTVGARRYSLGKISGI